MVGHELGATAMEKSGMAGTQAGGLMAVIGGLTLNDVLAVAGFCLALVSVAFQVWATWYFKSRHLAIAQKRLEADLSDQGDEGD